MLPIQSIANKLDLPDAYLEPLGPFTAKVKLDLLADPNFPLRGKLILVTATTPTIHGEGKTVTSIGLAQALEQLGKRAVVTSREPSIGPVFGLKGGAAGGGLSQVEPAGKINLHFHGDFHAITSAHNLLSALIDAHIFHGNELALDPDQIAWPRALDMNDRALRRITVCLGKGNGTPHESRFVITAASEIMAIMALTGGRGDLRDRLSRIVIGFDREARPVSAARLGGIEAMLALLEDALLPNLVQTTEGTPAFVHTGPFANIAHGTSSVLSQQMALRLADYVVNETGFASDLGAEKYFDLVMRSSGIQPAVAVLVTTVQSLRGQGRGHLETGFSNLDAHVRILRNFRVPIVAALNRFPGDTDEELARIAAHCDSLGIPSAIAEPFTKGGAGSIALAEQVAAILDETAAAPRVLYPLDIPFGAKLEIVAREVYGADGVTLGDVAREKLDRFAQSGYGALPICIAKTQYTLSDNPKLPGAPAGWTLNISDAFLSAGAGFVVATAGAMLLMPGLPKTPLALKWGTD